MELRLEGKRALISGGSRGIGFAVASAMAGERVRVAIAARGGAVFGAAQELSRISGQRVHGFVADTRSTSSIESLVRDVHDTLGGIDILVNCAATPWSPQLSVGSELTTDELMMTHFDTKVVGYLRTVRAVAPLMKANGWGRIINVGGLGARTTGSIALTVRNVGVSALTKNLADELGPSGINVTVVHPGPTRVPAVGAVDEEAGHEEERPSAVGEAAWRGGAGNSIGRLVDAAEVADVITFLASPRSAAINGDAIAVGGGHPGAVYY